MDDKKRQTILNRAAKRYRAALEASGDIEPGEDAPSPLEVMAIAMFKRWSLGDDLAPVYAAQIAKELAKYMHPTLSSVDAKQEITKRVVQVINQAWPTSQQLPSLTTGPRETTSAIAGAIFPEADGTH